MLSPPDPQGDAHETAQVEVIVPGPKKAAAVKVALDSPDRMLQHIAHLAGLQMSKARKGKLIPLLGPSAVKRNRVQSAR